MARWLAAIGYLSDPRCFFVEGDGRGASDGDDLKVEEEEGVVEEKEQRRGARVIIRRK